MRVIRRQARANAAGEPTRVVDARGRLSEGVLVEASVLARLLGVRLLKLEATALLTPARERPTAPPRSPTPALPGVRGRTGLAAAVRDLDEGAILLEQARRSRQARR